MRPASSLQSLYLRFLSRPRHWRSLYAHLHRARPRRILQIGLGDGANTERILGLSLAQPRPEPVKFTGIDLFESRPQSDIGMSLKEAHARFRGERLEIRLLPGQPAQVLTRFANELRGTDLVLIAGDQASGVREHAWHFLPRMLHKDSQVWIESQTRGASSFQILSPADLRVPVSPGKRKIA